MLNKIKKLLNIEQETEICEVSDCEVMPYAQIENLFDELNSDTIRLELGSDFYSYGDFLCDTVSGLRKEIKENTGFILPKVHILSNDNLQENECVISVLGEYVYDDFLIPTAEELAQNAKNRLKEIFKLHIDEIFTNEIAEKYIDVVQQNNSRLVNQLTNAFCTVSIKTILIELLKKQKSINNINYIFEKIAETAKPDEYPWHLKDPFVIAEKVCKGI